MNVPINYHGCTVITSGSENGPAIISPKGMRYEYRLPKRRRWNIGLRRYAYELTGRIEVITGPTSAFECGDWSDACRYVAERDV